MLSITVHCTDSSPTKSVPPCRTPVSQITFGHPAKHWNDERLRATFTLPGFVLHESVLIGQKLRRGCHTAGRFEEFKAEQESSVTMNFFFILCPFRAHNISRICRPQVRRHSAISRLHRCQYDQATALTHPAYLHPPKDRPKMPSLTQFRAHRLWVFLILIQRPVLQLMSTMQPSQSTCPQSRFASAK